MLRSVLREIRPGGKPGDSAEDHVHLLAFWALPLVFSSVILAGSIINGWGPGGVLNALLILVWLLGIWRCLQPLRRPRRHRLDLARVDALSDRDLDVLEAALAARAEDELKQAVSETELLRQLHQVTARKIFDGSAWEFLDPESRASIAALERAGLLEDLRQRRCGRLLFAVSDAAGEILAGEREQREEASLRVGPVGPRQRTSALAN